MTKIETVRALNDSGTQLLIVDSLRLLQQDLARLPQAISSETAQALEPLARLRQDVGKVLIGYEKVTAHQRQVLDALTQEMATHAAQAFEVKAKTLDATLSDLARSIARLNSSLASMVQTTQQVAQLPDKLGAAQQRLIQGSKQLTEVAQAMRPRLWRQALGLILAGVVGGLLVGTGHSVSDRLLPRSAVQRNAIWASHVWNNATSQERKLLSQIANRPEN